MKARNSIFAPKAIRRLLLASLPAVFGCESVPTATSDPVELVVSPEQQWAGGVVEVLGLPGGLIRGDVVLADDDTMELVSMEGDAFTGRLPTAANGPVRIEVRRSDQVAGWGVAEAFGFEETKVYPVPLLNYITAVPSDWGVSVVGPAYKASYGQGPTSPGISWIHLSAGIARQFPGTPDLRALYRTGVDPVSGELYWEWDRDSDGSRLRKARVVAGELRDLGWVARPCQRWGCEPLLDDIWINLDDLSTCRIVARPTGESCEFIESLWGDDVQGISRLHSSDVAMVLDWPAPVFRLSTGRLAYWLDQWPKRGGGARSNGIVATDERRGVFYFGMVRPHPSWADSVVLRIQTMRGVDGFVVRAFDLSVPPRNASSRLAYDPELDLLLVLLGHSSVLELRDPVSFELVGRVELPTEPHSWGDALVLPDVDTGRIFIVFSSADGFPGVDPRNSTPVMAIRRLP